MFDYVVDTEMCSDLRRILKVCLLIAAKKLKPKMGGTIKISISDPCEFG
jgi:hypothetical protein